MGEFCALYLRRTRRHLLAYFLTLQMHFQLGAIGQLASGLEATGKHAVDWTWVQRSVHHLEVGASRLAVSELQHIQHAAIRPYWPLRASR